MTVLAALALALPGQRRAVVNCPSTPGCCARHPRACTAAAPGGAASGGNSSQSFASCSGEAFGELLRAGFDADQLPFRLNSKATGLDGKLHVPKRVFTQGKLSSSLNRQMQAPPTATRHRPTTPGTHTRPAPPPPHTCCC